MKKLALFALAALIVVSFSVPAMAKTVSFYGNVRAWTGYVDHDKDWDYPIPAVATIETDNPYAGQKTFKTFTYDFLDQTNSRFGAKFKSGNVSAVVEWRPREAGKGWIRLFWGEYNFGSFSLGIGQHYVPTCIPIFACNFAEGLQGDFGDMWGRLRQPMMMVKVPFSMGLFKIAFVAPNKGSLSDLETQGNAPSVQSYKRSIPEIDLGLSFALGPAKIDLAGSYSTVKYENKLTNFSESVDSWIGIARAVVNVGPVIVKGLYWTGQNTKNWGIVFTTLNYAQAGVKDNNKIEDADHWGAGLDLCFVVSDTLNFEGGYVYNKSERFQKEEDDQSMWYIQCNYTVAKGFTISPEIGLLDQKDYTNASGTTTDQGKLKYYGIYWKISF